ncbi:hypothetical protein GCM10023322_14330 [Rugosimonospora acidiphila]|uniref:Uncharacterized protein n=1 Tax=Rugosimonospora acidiphila TaxID=556531 RepID=A0ABP9RNC3_9ACTN
MPRLADFARQLGAAQARWAGRVPDLPWLSRHWLDQYLTGRRFPSPLDDVPWGHPAAGAWPEPARPLARQPFGAAASVGVRSPTASA